jgi:hypothetical protein
VTDGQITEVKFYAPNAFYGKIFSNDANKYYKHFLSDHFAKVTIFIDFLEVFINKFFRFTRDIAQSLT